MTLCEELLNEMALGYVKEQPEDDDLLILDMSWYDDMSWYNDDDIY